MAAGVQKTFLRQAVPLLLAVVLAFAGIAPSRGVVTDHSGRAVVSASAARAAVSQTAVTVSQTAVTREAPVCDEPPVTAPAAAVIGRDVTAQPQWAAASGPCRAPPAL